MKKLLLIIIILAIFQSCCDTKVLGTYSLTETELSIQPYKGGEQLVFTNISNDTMRFNVSIPQKYMTTQLPVGTYDDGSRCENDHFLLEEQTTNLTSTENLFISLKFYINVYSDRIEKGFNIFCYNYLTDQEKIFSGVSPKLINDTLLNGDYGDTIYTYIDTLHINNRDYYNVYKFKLKLLEFTQSDYVDSVFYSKEKGIVSLKMKLHDQWVLE